MTSPVDQITMLSNNDNNNNNNNNNNNSNYQLFIEIELNILPLLAEIEKNDYFSINSVISRTLDLNRKKKQSLFY